MTLKSESEDDLNMVRLNETGKTKYLFNPNTLYQIEWYILSRAKLDTFDLVIAHYSSSTCSTVGKSVNRVYFTLTLSSW